MQGEPAGPAPHRTLPGQTVLSYWFLRGSKGAYMGIVTVDGGNLAPP